MTGRYEKIGSPLKHLELTDSGKAILVERGNSADYTIDGSRIIVTNTTFGSVIGSLENGDLMFTEGEGIVADAFRGRWTRTTSAGAAPAVAGSPPSPSVLTMAGDRNVSGIWDFGSWGTLELTQTGSRITGVNTGTSASKSVSGLITSVGIVLRIGEPNDPCAVNIRGNLTSNGAEIPISMQSCNGYRAEFTLRRK